MISFLAIFATSAFATTVSIPSPAAVASPAASQAAAPEAPLADAEKKKLRVEFQKAHFNQRGALAHQEKSAMKELAAAQSMKQKKWREEQKKARQVYFDAHTSGPERREYVQAYQKKLQDFDIAAKHEIAETKKNWADRQQALKQQQKEREEKFNASLSEGKRPPAELWPSGN